MYEILRTNVLLQNDCCVNSLYEMTVLILLFFGSLTSVSQKYGLAIKEARNLFLGNKASNSSGLVGNCPEAC